MSRTTTRGTGDASPRHRRFDIRVAINRTLVFAVLAIIITAVYVAVVVGIGTLFGATDNLLLAIGATAIVALGFEPMRERVQHAANVLVFGERATPYEVLAGMTSTDVSSDPDQVVAQAARLLAEATGAAHTTIWRADADHLVPGWGHPDVPEHAPMRLTDMQGTLPDMGEDLARALVIDGDIVGAITLTMRPGEPVRPADIRLIDEFAGQAAVLVAHARLQADLRASLDALAASRRRLLTAQADARRRLERDIHDGAQQHLVALRVKAGLAHRLAAQEEAHEAASLLERLADDTAAAIGSLRSLARGVYPPLLEAEGIVAAVAAQARICPVPVVVTADDLARDDREIETTVYFCVLEALTNAAKHANASRIEVALTQQPDTLRFRVTDDGVGFEPSDKEGGTGLTGLRDRLDAVGGGLEVDSQPGEGTTIEGWIPRQAEPDAAVHLSDRTSGVKSDLETNPMAPASMAPRS